MFTAALAWYLMICYSLQQWAANISLGFISLKRCPFLSISNLFVREVSSQFILVLFTKGTFGKFCNVHDPFLNILNIFAFFIYFFKKMHLNKVKYKILPFFDWFLVWFWFAVGLFVCLGAFFISFNWFFFVFSNFDLEWRL